MTSSLPLEAHRYATAHVTWLVGIVVTVALLVTPNSSAAFQAEYGAYQQAVSRVCTTKVTPELVQLYQAGLAGPRPPEMAYLDCFQTR